MPAFASFTKGVPNANTSATSLSQQLHALAPLDVARQLTLIEFDLLQAVGPLDFLKASKDTNKATTGMLCLIANACVCVCVCVCVCLWVSVG